MDKEKIMKLCQRIGLVAMSDKKHYPTLHSDFDFINNSQMDIFREITAPPKSNDEHTAAYWMRKTMDAAHEAYDRLKDTADFKNAIAEVEAIKQRMGITEQKKQTNADRIRQMTDEELAEFLNEIIWRCRTESCVSTCPLFGCCFNEVERQVAWLKQEVSEDAEKE